MSKTNSKQKFKKEKFEEDFERKGKKGKKGKYMDKVDRNIPGSTLNHPSWYYPSVEMLNNSSSLSYPTRLGTKFNLGEWYGDNEGMSRDYERVYTVPGVMTFQIAPSYGLQKVPSRSTPINQVARAAMAYIRSKNSGAKNGDFNDYFIYFMSMDNAASYLEYLRRVYGILNVWNSHSEYEPDTLLEAIGVSRSAARELREHKTDFFDTIQALIYQTNSFPVPKIFKVQARHQFLYSKIFMDNAGTKGQLYAFKPDGFYYRDAVELKYWRFDAHGDGTYILNHTNTLSVWEQLKMYAEMFIYPLGRQEDVGFLGGDIEKAYPDADLIKISDLDPNYVVTPEYDPVVLTQMHNATVCPIKFSSISEDVENQALIVDYNIDSEANDAMPRVSFMDLPVDNPQPIDNMYATRLTTLYGINNNSLCGGSEIVTKIKVYDVATGVTDVTSTVEIISLNGSSDISEKMEQIIKNAALFSSFHYAPLFTYYRDDEATQNDTGVYVIGETYNMRLLQRSELEHMNQCAFIGLFNYQEVAKGISQ